MTASPSGGDHGERPAVSVVILAYLDEPDLEASVHSALASIGVDADVVLVDNGCTDGAVGRLEGTEGVRVLHPGRNLGFTGGNNAGAAAATGQLVALLNGDAVAEPTALAALAAAALRPDIGIASACVTLASEPELLNSRGSDVHFLGFGWSGGFREPVVEHRAEVDVLGASGAAMAMRRELWDDLGGFHDDYFAYLEDTELSLRCWQRGLRVVYVPEAVVRHRYEFSRNPRKFYLLERNRLLLVLTMFELRTLLVLLAPLVAAEAATLAMAIASGWGREKVASWGWLLKNGRRVAARRRQLQRERTVPDRSLAPRFVAHLDPGNYPLPAALRPFDAVLAGYWRLVRRLL